MIFFVITLFYAIFSPSIEFKCIDNEAKLKKFGFDFVIVNCHFKKWKIPAIEISAPQNTLLFFNKRMGESHE